MFRAEAAGSRFCARTAESAAQSTGLTVKDEINPKPSKQSPAALFDNRIVAKQLLTVALVPSAHHCNLSSQITGHVGYLFRSPTTP